MSTQTINKFQPSPSPMSGQLIESLISSVEKVKPQCDYTFYVPGSDLERCGHSATVSDTEDGNSYCRPHFHANQRLDSPASGPQFAHEHTCTGCGSICFCDWDGCDPNSEGMCQACLAWMEGR